MFGRGISNYSTSDGFRSSIAFCVLMGVHFFATVIRRRSILQEMSGNAATTVAYQVETLPQQQQQRVAYGAGYTTQTTTVYQQ
jgi:hypothetical protein